MMTECALCGPTQDDLLWQDDFCRIVLLHDKDYPAYCRVELLAHIKEMTDLPPPDRARTMKIVFAVETALREVIRPDKINLASLGNKTPHMHWHVLPRFESDRHFPNSHWGETVRHSEAQPLSKVTRDRLQKVMIERVECTLKS